MKNKRKSEFVSLDTSFFEKTDRTIERFNEFVAVYVYLQDPEKYANKLKERYGEYVDESNILYYLEKLKVEHFAFLNSFLQSYSKILAYKENFEFLSAERKRLKSETIAKIMSSDKVSSAAAEKLVYGDDFYIDGLREIQELKEYFIKIENAFDLQKDLSKNIYQSISNIKKNV